LLRCRENAGVLLQSHFFPVTRAKTVIVIRCDRATLYGFSIAVVVIV
jgi:hypothetical protein